MDPNDKRAVLRLIETERAEGAKCGNKEERFYLYLENDMIFNMRVSLEGAIRLPEIGAYYQAEYLKPYTEWKSDMSEAEWSGLVRRNGQPTTRTRILCSTNSSSRA